MRRIGRERGIGDNLAGKSFFKCRGIRVTLRFDQIAHSDEPIEINQLLCLLRTLKKRERESQFITGLGIPRVMFKCCLTKWDHNFRITFFARDFSQESECPHVRWIECERIVSYLISVFRGLRFHQKLETIKCRLSVPDWNLRGLMKDLVRKI